MGAPSEKTLFMLELLLSVGILRGKDSTGVASIGKESSSIVKDTVWPLELIKSKEYRENIAMSVKESYCYIGHNRSATIGKVTKENAHPIVYNNITLVHNGTLKAFLKSKEKNNFSTDSQSITYVINEKGIDWTWENLDGAASLIYYDKANETLNIISNGERPLFFATTKGNRLLIISSEGWMIRKVCERLKVKLKKDKVYYPENNVLFSFIYNEEKKKIIHINGRMLEPFKKYEPFKKTAPNEGYLDKWYKKNKEGTFLDAREMQNEEDEWPENASSILEIDGMTKKKFDEKYQYCALCSTQLIWRSAVVIDDDLAACGNCTTSDQLEKIRIDSLLKGI